jgi:hypothetical protein
MKGPLGIDTDDVGEVAQAFARCLIDRGFDETDVRHRLSQMFDEAEFWQHGNVHDAIDDFAFLLGYKGSYPEEAE